MQVKGKQLLCVCNDYKTRFKSIQGRNGFTLFERYNDLENIVNKHIDGKYRHFLAQPEVDGNDLYWFSQPYSEVPKRLSELEGTERTNYQKTKDETFAHYRKITEELKKQNKSAEAEILESATKFVNDDFIYCYDGKAVLGVWGMELRDEVREPLGIAMKNAFEKPRKKQSEVHEESEMQAPDETTIETPDTPNNIVPPEDTNTPPEPKPEPKKTFKVRFSGRAHGILHGQTEYDKYYEEKVVAGEIPDVIPEKNYRFIGWDRNPVNHIVTEDTEFIAQYEEVPVRRSWWAGLWGAGCLNWLLLMLLLALLGLLIWYLLGHTPLNFCPCDCNCSKYEPTVDTPQVIPVPIDTIRDKDQLPKPTKNCGVHFSGWYLSDRNEYPWRDCSEIFQEEEFGEYVGQGYYPDNTKILPKSMKNSFDAVAVSKGTHLIMYEKPNFEGRIVLDVKGPMLIENVYSKGRYDKLLTYTFKEDLQKLFPPERRQWSSENMHNWAYGSCKIICEQCK